MKKELLIASALVGSLGVAGIAEAATYSISGNHRSGISATDNDAGTETRAVSLQSSFIISVSETTDGGTTISSGFDIAEESGGAGGGTSSGLSLAKDGRTLDLISAGNASGSHDVSIPGSAGEEGITVTCTNSAPTGLDFAQSTTGVGFELHSGDDFIADGLKMSASWSTDSGAAKTATPIAQGHYALGGTYVTAAGGADLTIGAGYSSTDFGNTSTEASNDMSSTHMGISAVSGDLTVAIGYADGDIIRNSTTTYTEASAHVLKAGLKWVAEDLTFNLGVVAGEAKDSTALGTAGTTTDSIDKTTASVSYAIASGVTGIIGYSATDSSEEATVVDTESNGSAWYIGANIAF